LSGAALAEVERKLRGRLRAHHLSMPLIDRHLDDAVQKGVFEWLRVEAEGKEVRDPKGFVIEAAFLRTIDEVRREARRADGAILEGLLENGSRSASSAEDVAIESLESLQLQRAISSLPVEQRQVLALHYFGELDQKRAAEVLYMSERTFRRRLKDTLSTLGELLGAAAPEQGSLKGVEIGLGAWAGLGGGRLLTSSGSGPLTAFLDSVRELPVRIFGRLRGSATNLIATETPERIGAVAGGPAGKVIGGCAGAAVVCALSGVVGPGVDLGDRGAPVHGDRPAGHKIASRRPLVSHGTKIVLPQGPSRVGGEEEEARPPDTSGRPSSSRPARRGKSSDHSSESSKKKEAREGPPPTEAEAAEEEFSGLSQAAAESDSTSPELAVEPGSVQRAAPVEAQAEPVPASNSSAPAPKSQAESEFGFEK
jgi:RNA polymerase sigma factor (sigma-70 family)